MNRGEWIYVTLLVVLICYTNGCGQGLIHFDQSDSIRVLINGVQQSIQQARPNTIHLGFGGDAVLDSATTASAFVAEFSGLLSSLPFRDLQIQNLRPDRLGTFWDFEIRVDSMTFNDTLCVAHCRYSLCASTSRSISGSFEFTATEGDWQISRVVGLASFLTVESTVLQQLTAGGKSK